ncbi:MAG: hypothetical protein NC311_02065 [Muribaculaceae bacterium]|nr:hypothetical protein [Muribaculaceae bacterium]
MNFIKRYLKLLIGIAVLILVLVVFACTVKNTDNLEIGTLKDWQRAPLERRTASARMLLASDDNLELAVRCVDKMAALPDASEMAVQTAIALCNTGIQLKENL